MDEEARRKLQAKRLNEHVKLLATTLNASGLVIFGAGVLQPLLAQTPTPAVDWRWVALSLILHLIAQAALCFIRLD